MVNGTFGNVTGNINAFAASTLAGAGHGIVFGSDGPCYAPSSAPFGMVQFSSAGTPTAPAGTSAQFELVETPCVWCFQLRAILNGR